MLEGAESLSEITRIFAAVSSEREEELVDGSSPRHHGPKGQELAYVRDIIAVQGLDTLLVDTGIFEPSVSPDISREEVAQLAGIDLDSIVSRRDRGSGGSHDRSRRYRS